MKLRGYTGLVDSLLQQGITNCTVVLNCSRQAGIDCGAAIVKECNAVYKHLLLVKR